MDSLFLAHAIMREFEFWSNKINYFQFLDFVELTGRVTKTDALCLEPHCLRSRDWWKNYESVKNRYFHSFDKQTTWNKSPAIWVHSQLEQKRSTKVQNRWKITIESRMDYGVNSKPFETQCNWKVTGMYRDYCGYNYRPLKHLLLIDLWSNRMIWTTPESQVRPINSSSCIGRVQDNLKHPKKAKDFERNLGNLIMGAKEMMHAFGECL